MRCSKGLTSKMILLGFVFLVAGTGNTVSLASSIEENPSFDGGYIDTDERFEHYEPLVTENPLLREAALPEQYSIADCGQLTTVKNQKNHGTCWAFSVAGAAENFMLRNALADAPDYSEYQLAYFFYHHVDDSLGNLKGDVTSILTDKSNYLTLGGNNTWTAFALSSWLGLVEEEKAPYEDATASSSLPESLAYEDCLHLQNVYFLSMQDKNEVKKLILERGAVVSAMYIAPGNSYYYFNSEKNSSYQDVSKSANHSILVVGWDDNYDAANFKEGKQPAKNGAWLVKNSWGPTASPYVWISYEDTCLSQQNAYSYEFADSNNYQNNYQYDGCFGTSYLTIKNGCSMANDFVASASVMEEIKAVSFALKSTNVSYKIQIYRNSPAGQPAGGEPMLEHPIEGQTTYAGCYTIPVDTPVDIVSGDHFTVVVTVRSLIGDEGVSCYVDGDQQVSGLVQFDSTTYDNQSYVITSSGVVDLHKSYTSDYCFRLKAFTDNVDLTNPIKMGRTTVSSVPKKEYTGSPVEPLPTVKYNSMTLVKDRDYRLVYENNVERGTATITIKGMGNFTGSKKLNFKIVGKLKPTTVYNGVNYSAVYDYDYYTTRYEDVWEAYKGNDQKVIQHFVKTGMKEGRQGIETFDVMSYAYKYYDIRKTYKNDLSKYYLHYINYGKAEGRKATGTTSMKGGPTVYKNVDYSAVFNVWYYAKTYPDVKKKYGLDDAAYLKHFVQTGMVKGRKGNSKFNVKHYKSRYSDLRRLYGDNLKKYYLHYINTGQAEGRNGK